MCADITPSRIWFWDSQNNYLDFESSGEKKRIVAESSIQLTQSSSNDSISLPQRAEQKIKFQESIDQLAQTKFRKLFMRTVKNTEVDIVTLQDIKDVVFYLLITPAPKHFIEFFYTPDVDHFLIALILYFQYYFEIWEDIQYRTFFSLRKLRHPIGQERENLVRFYLSKLRLIVAKDYARMLLGSGQCKPFHHMANKENKSLSEKDILLFEHVIVFSVRIVWIALMRRDIMIIDKELNRLLRTDHYNVATKQGTYHGPQFSGEYGFTNKIAIAGVVPKERQFLVRSPLIHEILGTNSHIDFQKTEFKPSLDILQKIYTAFSTPEEYYEAEEICVGILGHTRDAYEPLLQPREKLTETVKRYMISSGLPGIFALKLNFQERSSSKSCSSTFRENGSSVDPSKVDLDAMLQIDKKEKEQEKEEEEVVQVIVRSKEYYKMAHQNRIKVARKMWLQNRLMERRSSSLSSGDKRFSQQLEYLKSVVIAP